MSSTLAQLEAARDAAQAAVDAEKRRLRDEARAASLHYVGINGERARVYVARCASNEACTVRVYKPQGAPMQVRWHATVERPVRPKQYRPAGGRTLEVCVGVDGVEACANERAAMEWESHKRDAWLVLPVAREWLLRFRRVSSTHIVLLAAVHTAPRNG